MKSRKLNIVIWSFFFIGSLEFARSSTLSCSEIFATAGSSQNWQAYREIEPPPPARGLREKWQRLKTHVRRSGRDLLGTAKPAPIGMLKIEPKDLTDELLNEADALQVVYGVYEANDSSGIRPTSSRRLGQYINEYDGRLVGLRKDQFAKAQTVWWKSWAHLRFENHNFSHVTFRAWHENSVRMHIVDEVRLVRYPDAQRTAFENHQSLKIQPAELREGMHVLVQAHRFVFPRYIEGRVIHIDQDSIYLFDGNQISQVLTTDVFNARLLSSSGVTKPNSSLPSVWSAFHEFGKDSWDYEDINETFGNDGPNNDFLSNFRGLALERIRYWGGPPVSRSIGVGLVVTDYSDQGVQGPLFVSISNQKKILDIKFHPSGLEFPGLKKIIPYTSIRGVAIKFPPRLSLDGSGN